MREELRKYANEAYSIATHAANEIGPRLPGSENEAKFHGFMKGKLEDIGLKPVQEKFLVSPRASIGGIPYAGWAGIIAAIVVLLGTVFNAAQIYFLAFIGMVCVWGWLINSVFFYKTWLDWCFHQEVSHNTYAELFPKSGKYDYTIMLSGHTDTSWNWKHSAIKSKLNPAFAFIKVGLGALCIIFTTVSALVLFCMLARINSIQSAQNVTISMAIELANLVNNYVNFSTIYAYLTPFLIIGSFLVTLWLDKNEKVASPGAMDNATGIAIAYTVTKYFKENPDKMPKNCRIIDLNCGSEEAGLRGSIAFTRAHKGEDILKNCWNINLDSIADKDFFEAVHGDTWQFTRFDKDLEKMLIESMREAGIEKPGNIVNPVGGCDSTPFTKVGVKSITFAAQNPILTNYYHTFYDQPERFSADTVGLGLDVVLRVIGKIAEKEGDSVESVPAAKEESTPAAKVEKVSAKKVEKAPAAKAEKTNN